MASRHVKQFTFEDFISKQDMLQMTKDWLQGTLEALRAGRIIKKGYAAATIKKRTRHGLQTSHVDLTGNNRYSRKGWRLLESIGVQPVSNRTAKIVWKSQRASQLYQYQVLRYGKII
jgi:hypothetical protein